MGYKVVKKKPVVLLPFKSSSLSPAIGRMLDENLSTEMGRSGVFDVLNNAPDFSLDATLKMPKENLDMFRLAEMSDIQYLVVPRIEKENDNFKVIADLYDVTRITGVAQYTRECNCPFEDVVFLVLADLSEKFSKGKFALGKQCPPDMVKFDKSTYTMGSPVKYDNNSVATVRVNNFCIDKYEFPNVLGRDVETEKTWAEAQEACRSRHKRLCSEFEWEYACRGKFNLFYPYGNQYDSKKCNTETKKQERAGSLVDCHGESNVYDMSGNVNEWTGSNWDANISNKVIRGGGWFSGAKESRCTLRFSNHPNTRARPIGFRCCQSLEN
jgi:formylglycine-generating enzyme required for sulfatase activity